MILACESSNPALHRIYSAYKLNKQSDNVQPWRTPFPILKQSTVPCQTVASYPVYRLLRRQVRWSEQIRTDNTSLRQGIVMKVSLSVVTDSLRPHGLYNPWNSPGQNTREGSLSLLHEIFTTQELNQGLLHCRRILYQLSCEQSKVAWCFHFFKDFLVCFDPHSKGFRVVSDAEIDVFLEFLAFSMIW